MTEPGPRRPTRCGAHRSMPDPTFPPCRHSGTRSRCPSRQEAAPEATDARDARKACRSAIHARHPLFANCVHLRTLTLPAPSPRRRRPSFPAVAGAPEVLAGNPIRGDLQPDLAVARVAEQPPASPPASLMLGTTRDSYEPAMGPAHGVRFEPTEQEPTPGARNRSRMSAGHQSALLVLRRDRSAAGRGTRTGLAGAA